MKTLFLYGGLRYSLSSGTVLPPFSALASFKPFLSALNTNNGSYDPNSHCSLDMRIHGGEIAREFTFLLG